MLAKGWGIGYVHFADQAISGEMAEWSNAPVLKTGEVRASVGSNPTLPAIIKPPCGAFFIA